MKIGIDLDDTLAAAMASLTAYHNSKYGTDLKPEDFFSYNFEEVWGGTKEEAVRKCDEFYSTEEAKLIRTIDGAVEAVSRLKEDGHELYVITARPEKMRGITEDWIANNLPGMISSMHFTSHFHGLTKEKADVCSEMGIELMIEDVVRHAKICADRGMDVILFNRPWNTSHALPENVRRVDTWDEAARIVQSMC